MRGLNEIRDKRGHKGLTVMFIYLTRMHSSRMRTASLLPVSPSIHCSRGGGYLPGGIPARGCTCQGIPAQGVYLPEGVNLLGDTCPGGVPAGGVPAQVLPPVNRMTDRCKNITLPQTLFAGGKNSFKDNPCQR